MGANTPHLNLYLASGGSSGDPAGDENYDVDNDNNNMRKIDTWATGVDADLGTWLAWTPALQATGFSQSGGTFTGRYQQIGKTVIGHATISLAAVSNSGSGSYKLTLPVPPAAAESNRYIGQVWAANAGNSISNVTASLNGAPLRADGIVPITFTGTTWQNGNPLGALANATIIYSFAYEAA